MLSELPHEAAPPPELQERIVAGLRAQGSIRSRRAWRRSAVVAAMLVLAATLGYLVGVRTVAGPRPPAVASAPAFALLVYDPIGPRPDAPPIAVAEASAWAGGLAEIGVLGTAEKLENGGRRLGLRGGVVERLEGFPFPGTDLVLGGFFMIRADSYDDAERIAADCPLLRHGSIIEIRAIDDV